MKWRIMFTFSDLGSQLNINEQMMHRQSDCIMLHHSPYVSVSSINYLNLVWKEKNRLKKIWSACLVQNKIENLFKHLLNVWCIRQQSSNIHKNDAADQNSTVDYCYCCEYSNVLPTVLKVADKKQNTDYKMNYYFISLNKTCMLVCRMSVLRISFLCLWNKCDCVVNTDWYFIESKTCKTLGH